MINTTVKIDRDLLHDVQKRLGSFSNKAPNAIANALNRAITTVASHVSREVRKEYNIKAKDVKATLKKVRATRANLSAMVSSQGEVVPLDRFKVSPKTPQPKRKKPIKVAVKKTGLKPLLGAFVADINGIKVFKRVTKHRLPIQRMFGPSIPQMLGNEEIRNKINREGEKMFYKRLDHEINRILSKGSGAL
jgi:hypothetical protein